MRSHHHRSLAICRLKDCFICSHNPPRPTINLCCCVVLQRRTLSIKSLGHGSSARLVHLRVVVYTRNSRGIRLDGVLLPGVKTKACKSSCTFLIRLLHGEENLIRAQVPIQSLFKGTRRRRSTFCQLLAAPLVASMCLGIWWRRGKRHQIPIWRWTKITRWLKKEKRRKY